MSDSGSTLKRDVISAYVAALVRVLCWVVISAAVFRSMGDEAYAMLTLIRGTLGILTYAFLGLAPAMVHFLAIAARDSVNERLITTYATGQRLALLYGAFTFLLIGLYFAGLSWFHDIPRDLRDASRWLALLMGIGLVLRLVSETSASLLQVRSRIVLDNVLNASTDIIWAAAVVGFGYRDPLGFVGPWFVVSGALLAMARTFCAMWEVRLTTSRARFDRSVARALVSYGALFTFGQLANYLYAPIDYILINQLVDPRSVGIYGAAVQIDAGLLLLVSALAAVLLPHSAVAHAAGDVATVRRYYVRGTLLSSALLAGASVVVWWCSPWIFQIWLNDPMRATQQILPLVLFNTVVGGSAGVGRSILLAMGKVKPLTIAVLIAAVSNVIISYVAVRFGGFGLVGVIYGTIFATMGLGAWTPWYVLRTLKHAPKGPVELSAPIA